MNSFISYTNNQKLLLLSYQNFEMVRAYSIQMVRAYSIQIISRIDCKEYKTLKTKERMTDMDRTEII